MEDNFEQLRMMDEYRRKQNNRRVQKWRQNHPDKAAAIEIRKAYKLARKYPELGFVVIPPLTYCEEYDIKRVVSTVDKIIRENAANGVYGGGDLH